MKHYVYRITNLILRKHYYGCRTTKLEPELDLGKKYFSSSHDKDFIKDQKDNPQNYRYKVIGKFSSRKEAILFEIRLHNRFDVGINESFYNRSKQTSTGWDTTGRGDLGQARLGKENGMYGRKRTEAEKLKISEGTKIGMSKRLDKPWKQIISDDMKQRISNTVSSQRWVKKDNTHIKINKDELDVYISNGWTQGMVKRREQNGHRNSSHATIGRIWVVNAMGDSLQINKEELEKYENFGYVKGRKIKDPCPIAVA